MANIVYWGTGTGRDCIKLALDLAKSQGFHTNGQETYLDLIADTVVTNAPAIDIQQYGFSNTVYIRGNGFIYDNVNPQVVPNKTANNFTIYGTLTNNWVFDGIIFKSFGAFGANDVFGGKCITIRNCIFNTGMFGVVYCSSSGVTINVYNTVVKNSPSAMYAERNYDGFFTIEDCVFLCNGMYDGSQSMYGKFRRVYCSGTFDARPTDGIGGVYTGSNNSYDGTVKTNVLLNDMTFLNYTDPTHPLYLVPRPSYDWGVIDQTTNIPDNIISKNGITYDAQHPRCVGSMALPDDTIEPIFTKEYVPTGKIRFTYTGSVKAKLKKSYISDYSSAIDVVEMQSSPYLYTIPLADKSVTVYYYVEVI